MYSAGDRPRALNRTRNHAAQRVLARRSLGYLPPLSIRLRYLVVGEQRLAETVGEVAEVRHVEDRHVVRTPPALRLQCGHS